MGATLTGDSRSILRHSSWDGLLIALSLAHGVLLISAPSIPVIALGLWWNANTISHNFIHLLFFRSRHLNRLYSIYLTALLGIPQSLWREIHLWHHRQLAPTGVRTQLRCAGLKSCATRYSGRFALESALEVLVVLGLWTSLAALAPRFFVTVYLPGYVLGLGLCSLQGHFEHARGTTSHYGWLYNFCFFNDGYHIEHHLRSGEHWTRLPRHVACSAGLQSCAGHTQRSRWPPILRWLDAISLESLERMVVHSTALQRFVLARHERAFRALLPKLSRAQRITIVGGGLFPRTALILQKLLPDAVFTIVDVNARNLEIARTFLSDRVDLEHRSYDPNTPEDADLLVIPLSFIGDRDVLYQEPHAPATIVHDWMWRKTAESVPVSWLLLKRLNLVRRCVWSVGSTCPKPGRGERDTGVMSGEP